ncbi:LacI family DNA-binding transcriptional regulator [Alicyclobacillus dauci]|uniref:LacI family transcriptional regulator n=1 Tax=Alicyclobacillus dauci TaxID=1475485 RepID=A0ABY6Z8G8_9BACL|nr:LacI family DNA-binding transcriptional regulator [Alicyclobacillus dauci]WAH39154.1 LacI family transcriptional regulator [Alicyclobacillus dauci]
MTIRDVAKSAGVSPATVSRVLNKPDLVEPETRERVRFAMEKLNFQPNAIARGLSAQRSDTLGLIVPGITDLFFNELYRGIDRASQSYGMKVLLFNAEHARDRALDGFSFLGQHQVSGIIFTSKLVTEEFDPVLQRLRIPVVLVLTQSTAKTPLQAFRVDDIKAVFDVVSYLVSRGHHRIGMIAGKQDHEITGQLRLRGYEMGLQHFGIPYDPRRVEYGDYRFDEGYSAMQRLLDRQRDLQLTAVCTAADEMALGAIRCLYDNGLRVPEDMSVVGFDDLQISRMILPRMTTVAQPFADIGAHAVRWLMGVLGQDQTPSETGIYFLPHRLVERESVLTLV